MFALALAAVVTSASIAEAQARTGGSLDATIARRIGGEVALGFWEPTLARDIVFMAASVFASGRVGVWANDSAGLGTMVLEGTARRYFGEAYDDVGVARCCAVGNSTLSLMFGWSDRARFQVRGGPALVLPIAMLNEVRTSVEAISYYARALGGFWDPWDGFTRGPGVLARIDLDARFGALIFGGELGGGPSFWLLRGGAGDEPIVVAFYQAAAYVGVEPIDWLALGARVQVVGWSDGGGQPRVEGRPADAQVSLVPFVRFVARPAFIELRGTVNLDEPEGVVSRSVVWAVRIATGVSLGP